MFIPKLNIISVLLLLFILRDTAYSQVKMAIEDKLHPSVSVSMRGYIGDKLDLAYHNRILTQDVDRLIEPFNNKTETHLWQSEFWGKWFTSAVLAYRYHPTFELKKVLDDAVRRLIDTQLTDGYIGNYANDYRLEQWDIWGQKYSMLGLIAYYDLTKDVKSLEAARGIADQLIKSLEDQDKMIVQTGNYMGLPSSSVLEPMTQLYVRTKDKRYLHFAEEIVRQWESPVGPQLISKSTIDVGSRFLPFPNGENWVRQGQKAYEMMSCYEGLLELYRITGRAEYINAVTDTWQNIMDTEIFITGSGSASECWYHGKEHQQHVTKHSQETCVTVTWIKLNQQLLCLTGDSKYADAIEQSYYNALLGAMKNDGSTWAMYSPVSGIRTEGTNQCNMGLNCCVASGPRALYTLPLVSLMNDYGGVKVLFFSEGGYKFKTPKGQIAELIIETEYPKHGKINCSLKLAKSENFRIDFRLPYWSAQNSVAVNGELAISSEGGRYVSMERKWKLGDKIVLDLDMRTKLKTIEGRPSYLALQRGPTLLVRDFRYNDETDIDEIITPVMADDGTVIAELTTNDANHNWIAVRIPCLVGSWRLLKNADPVMLTFTDYVSAGNRFTDSSRYRIWFPQLIDVTDDWQMDN